MTTSALAAPATGAGTRATSTDRGHAPMGENRAGWLFATPFLLLYVVFLIGPVLIGLVISLFKIGRAHV